ncbi:MAG: hypothetical protein MK108_13410 [Mariniblastus sp.]|nr:hypothetical protein [Mariniblastus sp.]
MKFQTCLFLVALWIGPLDFLSGQVADRPGAVLDRVGDLEVAVILERLGAQMEEGVSRQQLADYAWHFQRLDRDRDGQHSPEEYIDNGNYMTPQSRRGIFRAADGDGNGFVTEAEYVLNRVITDEAKEIMQRLDRNRDGSIQKSEFIDSGKLKTEAAAAVFQAFDADQNGSLVVPEYLRIWGQWARMGRPPAAERISSSPGPARQDVFVQWLRTFDSNQDGQLDEREWESWMRQADQDGDGKFNRAEWERAMRGGTETKPAPRERPNGKGGPRKI